MLNWNPWHGCHKVSPGCRNCYVYRSDSRYGKVSSLVTKTGNFDLPLKRGRDKEYKLKSGEEVFACGTSDFFLAEADEWRKEAWEMIRIRTDLSFLIITKRIDRFLVHLPEDWGEGYDHVRIGCTTENQEMADYRLPIFLQMPVKHRIIICEPLLGPMNLEKYLVSGQFENLVAGGESGEEARVCNYDWILSLHDQCVRHHIPFWFKQTGRYFQKDGKLYTIERKYQHRQARKAGSITGTIDQEL